MAHIGRLHPDISRTATLSALRHTCCAALAVLLLAAAARILNAGSWAVWTDEGASLYLASDPAISVIFDKLTENHHPPLYFIALSRWESLVGDSRIALRMLTILGGVLATAIVYRLGRDWFGQAAAFYAALLFATADLSIHYAQQIRHYGWLVLAVALMSLLFLRCLRRPTLPLLVAYGLSVAFMLYVHYLGIALLLAQVGVVWVLWRGSLRDKLRFSGAWVLAGVLYTPWLIAVQQILQLVDERGLASRPNIAPTTLATLVEFTDLLADGQSALIVGVCALALWRLLADWRWSVGSVVRLYLVGIGAGMFAGMFVVNHWLPLLTPRTLVFLTPGVALLAGYGIALLPLKLRRLFAVSLTVLALASTRSIQPRLASDAVARELAGMVSPGDLIVLETGADDNAFQYELSLALPDPQPPIIRTLRWVGTRGGVLPVIDEIDYELRQTQRTWVIQWFQVSQVLPFLDGGGLNYVSAMSREMPVGAEYEGLFPDDTITVALYQRLDDDPRAFADRLTLHDAIFAGAQPRHLPLHVDLWWSAQQPLPLDYSVGVFLLDEGGVTRAEHNAPPGDTPTTQWQPGDLHFDRHTLTLPPDLPPGSYTLAVSAYWYGDLVPLEVEGEPLAVVGEIVLN